MTAERPTDLFDNRFRWRNAVIVNVTRKCPLTCQHCTVAASPHRSEEFAEDDLLQLVEALGRDPDVRLVVLSGGEPFLKLARLQRLIERATDNRLLVDVVTSAHWADSAGRAAETLDRLPSFTNLSISADRWHLPFVPLENIRNAALAALDRGIAVGIFMVDDGDDAFRASFDDAMGTELLTRVSLMVDPLRLAGRALESETLRNSVAMVPFAELPEESCQMPATPAIHEDGRVMACCGDTISDPDRWPALTHGVLSETPIGEILDRAGRNPLVHALRLLGPRRLAGMVQQRAGVELFDGRYQRNNPCDICRAVTTDERAKTHLDALLADPEILASLQLHRLLEFGESGDLDSRVSTPDASCRHENHSPRRSTVG